MPAAFHDNQFAVREHPVVDKQCGNKQRKSGTESQKIRGMSSDVILTNKITGNPLLVTSSTKRKDWVSQMTDINENVTSKNQS